jgi:hypothetical protein
MTRNLLFLFQVFYCYRSHWISVLTDAEKIYLGKYLAKNADKEKGIRLTKCGQTLTDQYSHNYSTLQKLLLEFK